jgi:processive 1,2-diacylglycerol beta-glucosyltransferase/1,2-diacylglycerol 3-beta-galactosyltransferase
VKPGIIKYILLTQPGKIVVFHFFQIKPVFEIIEEYKLDIPSIIVVTDPFTAHLIWILQKGRNFIIFSEMLKEKSINQGIDKNNLKVFPFVLDRKFSQKTSDSKKLIIRRKLGFKPDSKGILIMGGGDGMPHGKNIKLIPDVLNKLLTDVEYSH